MEKILLIEDNLQMQKYIQDFLQAQDYTVNILDDYDAVVDIIKDFKPSLILLDINLPKYDGFFYLKLIKKNFSIPVIILSARSDESEQIRGIENGATDYITKPFSINILLAKINSLLKREQELNQTNDEVLKCGDLTLENKLFKVSRNGIEMDLTKNEFKILSLFIEEQGNIISRANLLEYLWDDKTFVDDNTLTVNISRLKKKLQELGLDDVITSKRGVGYIFVYN